MQSCTGRQRRPLLAFEQVMFHDAQNWLHSIVTVNWLIVLPADVLLFGIGSTSAVTVQLIALDRAWLPLMVSQLVIPKLQSKYPVNSVDLVHSCLTARRSSRKPSAMAFLGCLPAYYAFLNAILARYLSEHHSAPQHPQALFHPV